MAGNTAGQNLEGFAYTAMNALHQSAVSFAGQNYGAQKYKRIGRIAWICQGSVFVVGFVISMGIYIFSPWLLQLYSTDPEVIQYGVNRLAVICTTYFMCGMMDVMVGILRGMGYSIAPMIVSLTGVCLFRVVWIYTIFAQFRSLQVLYISYPVTWTITFLVQLIMFLVIYRKLRRKEESRS